MSLLFWTMSYKIAKDAQFAIYFNTTVRIIIID